MTPQDRMDRAHEIFARVLRPDRTAQDTINEVMWDIRGWADELQSEKSDFSRDEIGQELQKAAQRLQELDEDMDAA